MCCAKRMGQLFSSFRLRHREEAYSGWGDILGKSRRGAEMQRETGEWSRVWHDWKRVYTSSMRWAKGKRKKSIEEHKH